MIFQVNGAKLPCDARLGILQETFLHASKALNFLLRAGVSELFLVTNQAHFNPKWESHCGGRVQGFNASLEGRRVVFIDLDVESFNGFLSRVRTVVEIPGVGAVAG